MCKKVSDGVYNAVVHEMSLAIVCSQVFFHIEKVVTQ